MANGEKVTVVESKKLPDDPPKKHNCRESSSSKVEMLQYFLNIFS